MRDLISSKPTHDPEAPRAARGPLRTCSHALDRAASHTTNDCTSGDRSKGGGGRESERQRESTSRLRQRERAGGRVGGGQ